MSYLAAGVAAVGVLCLLNLVFALGVIRRLREHSEQLARLARLDRTGSGSPDHAVLPAGAMVGSFRTEATGRGPLTEEDLADDTLVAFFSPTCKPCQEKLPGFVAGLADRPRAERGRVLAVVVGEARACAPMLASLASVVPAVREDEDGPVATAFAVRAFPTCARVGRGADGRLVVTEADTWPRSALPAAA
ncbi:hypothetical protein [Streptomyces sp. NPDC090022]|uniref:hypothetical protein n=1 Tax=Streptomyces sp. NPDC090022 TaxID=3365920 RepID=UPI00381D3893